MCKNLHVEGNIAILRQKLEFVGFLYNFIETIIFMVAILEHVSSERGGVGFLGGARGDYGGSHRIFLHPQLHIISIWSIIHVQLRLVVDWD